MKFFKFFTGGAVISAFLAFVACSDKEQLEEPTPEQEYTEADYAEAATLSSSDDAFCQTDGGYALSFSSDGGSIEIFVDCGCEWTASSDEDWLTIEPADSSILVTASEYTAEAAAEASTLSADEATDESSDGTEEETGGESPESSARTATITFKTFSEGIEFCPVAVSQAAPETEEPDPGLEPASIEIDPTTLSVRSAGCTDAEIEVTANYDWDYAFEDADWITCTKSEDGSYLYITVGENTGEEQRGAEITFSCTAPSSDEDADADTATATLTITQAAPAVIELDPAELSVPYSGCTDETVTVIANYDWDFTCEADWITCAKSEDGSGVTLTIGENTLTEERSAEITFTCHATSEDGDDADTDTDEDPDAGEGTDTDEDSDLVTVTLTVTQAAKATISLDTAELSIEASGCTDESITVTANYDWDFTCEADWITCTKAEDGSALTLTVGENPSAARSADITLTCTGSGEDNTATATLTVSQTEADASIELDPSELSIEAAGGEKTITVTANFDWTYSCEADWFTCAKAEDGSALTLTADENTLTQERSAEITFTCSGASAENTATATITVTQAEAQATISISPTELTFAAAGGEETVTVTTNYDDWDYNCSVSWLTCVKAEDGSTLTLTASENTLSAKRSTEITFSCAGTDITNSAATTLSVTQESSGNTTYALLAQVSYDGGSSWTDYTIPTTAPEDRQSDASEETFAEILKEYSCDLAGYIPYTTGALFRATVEPLGSVSWVEDYDAWDDSLDGSDWEEICPTYTGTWSDGETFAAYINCLADLEDDDDFVFLAFKEEEYDADNDDEPAVAILFFYNTNDVPAEFEKTYFYLVDAHTADEIEYLYEYDGSYSSDIATFWTNNSSNGLSESTAKVAYLVCDWSREDLQQKYEDSDGEYTSYDYDVAHYPLVTDSTDKDYNFSDGYLYFVDGSGGTTLPYTSSLYTGEYTQSLDSNYPNNVLDLEGGHSVYVDGDAYHGVFLSVYDNPGQVFALVQTDWSDGGQKYVLFFIPGE